MSFRNRDRVQQARSHTVQSAMPEYRDGRNAPLRSKSFAPDRVQGWLQRRAQFKPRGDHAYLLAAIAPGLMLERQPLRSGLQPRHILHEGEDRDDLQTALWFLRINRFVSPIRLKKFVAGRESLGRQHSP